MNDDVFNMELRKFLKQVGVTSQRAIEQAVQKALADGKLTGTEVLQAKVVLTLEPLGAIHEVTDSIALE
ncbi:hypothetical protein HHL28_10635 [Aerophototrophica crusticola]|uniref:Uncharacterized protein n=1 Tax=Aerophototrophica crusticola TaxID=1709002 RepID=A0A858R7W5_9PROT|nr:hypothetical protein HHL28_10635 [Rhodospirillaceae bacterium B3]